MKSAASGNVTLEASTCQQRNTVAKSACSPTACSFKTSVSERGIRNLPISSMHKELKNNPWVGLMTLNAKNISSDGMQSAFSRFVNRRSLCLNRSASSDFATLQSETPYWSPSTSSSSEQDSSE
ncbi:hypothetical protein M758_9G119700 [Ceratodon purpureus]|nr:hypothetical protein M758_9G119700 [Ceratodon purpureus]